MLFSTLDLKCPPLEPKKKNPSRDVLIKEERARNLLTEAEISEALKKTSNIHYVSKGILSTHQIVERILNVTGSSALLFATWAITEKPLRALEHMKNSGKLTSIEALIERKAPSHNPKAFGFMSELFDRVSLTTCHAKVALIENEKHKITLVTSSNWTTNRRIEIGTITDCPDYYDFHKRWIDDERK